MIHTYLVVKVAIVNYKYIKIGKIINCYISIKERKLTFGVFPGCPQFLSSNMQRSMWQMSIFWYKEKKVKFERKPFRGVSRHYAYELWLLSDLLVILVLLLSFSIWPNRKLPHVISGQSNLVLTQVPFVISTNVQEILC